MDRARVVAGFRRIRDRLRARGFTVVEVPGWETRGRSGLRGAAMVKHHTAGARSGGKTASLRVVTFGRAGLNNILCNWYRSRGPRPVAYVVGAGLAWHAGAGRYPGAEGNADFGLEEENDGTGEPWTAEELALSQAIDEEFCREFGYPPSRIVEHSEWASDRKVDRRGPGLVRGAAWRARVTAALSKPKPVPTLDEEDEDMPFILKRLPDGSNWLITNGQRAPIVDVPSLGALEARFGPAIPVNEKTVNAFPWDQRNVIKAQA